MIVAVDFDGTICEHTFPDIGRPAENAIAWLRKWQEAGIELVLWTVRGGEALRKAVTFCTSQGVEFAAINANCTEVFLPEISGKIYADVYVDDRAFGCPLKSNYDNGPVVVDWESIGPAILQLHKEVYSAG